MSENEQEFGEALKDQREKNVDAIRSAAESVRGDVRKLRMDARRSDRRGDKPAIARSVNILQEDRIIDPEDIDTLAKSLEKDADVIVSAMNSLDPAGELEDSEQDEAEDVEDERPKYDTSDYLATSISATSDMLSEISALQTRLSSFTGSVKGKVANAANTVAGWLKNLEQKIRNNIGNRLWNLVSSYVNLDSWSIYGDAGVNLLGLQGNVGIQVNFTN